MVQKKKSAKALIDFQKIFESSPDLYLIMTPDLHIVTANKACLKAMHTVLKDITGRYVFDAFPENPKDTPAAGMSNAMASFERVLKTRAPDEMAIQKYDIISPERKDGSYEEHYWNVANCPVLDGRGKVIYILCRIENITDFTPLLPQNATDRIFLKEQVRKALEALEGSKARYAEIIASAMDGIITIDSNFKVTVFNAAAEEMFGYSAHDIIGKSINLLIPERFRGAHDGQILNFGETNLSKRRMGRLGEIAGLRADGEEFPIESSISQMGEGANKMYTVIMRDVSEKRKIEAQFLRAQRLESVGRLAGGIAHDLNNILAPILLSIGLLKTMTKDTRAIEVLEAVDMSARRGSDIVQQVLSFARGVEGQMVEVQPRHLINDLMSMLRETLPKNINLKTEVDKDVWTVTGDPTQLHQVLLNLCVNACDAMPEGGNLIISAQNRMLDDNYVAMDSMSKAGPHAVISVTDTGSGIPPEVIDMIFDPFFTTKSTGKGTGLGLSTVMAIAKSHGGFVNVYSEVSKGTTFKVYLPAVTTVGSVGSSLRKEDAVPRGNGETILVVDDEASIRLITGQTLRAFGYKALTASNGAEAVAIYAQKRDEIATVLTDMMMPVMDGPATIYALMQINPKVKIIAASGLDANGNVARASNAGIKHFLKKPYTASALLQLLQTILAEKTEGDKQ